MNFKLRDLDKDKVKEIIKNKKGDILKVVIALIVIAVMIYEFGNEIKSVNFRKTFYILRDLGNVTILIMMIVGILAVMSTTLYDFSISKYFGFHLSSGKVLKIGWIANSINSFIGMGGIGGASVRTLLYKRENIDTKKAVNANFYIILSTGTGLSTLIILGFLKVFNFSSLIGESNFYKIILVVFMLYIPLYFLSGKIKFIREKILGENVEAPLRLKLMLFFSSIVEWLAAASFFAGISRSFTPNLSIRGALGVYIVAVTLGLASFIPSGLGSFDFAALLGLKLMGAGYEAALAGILTFRLFYYVVPWSISMVFLAIDLVSRRKKTKKEEKNISSEIGVRALAALVFLGGVILVLSSATPALADRIKVMHKVLSFPVLRFSKNASMAIGIILIILSRGIWDKIKSYYNLTVIFLLLGAFLTFIKGLDFEESVIMLIISGLLYLRKDNFYRESAPIRLKDISIVLISTTIMAFTYAGISYATHRHLFTTIESKNELLSRVFLFLIVTWIIAGLFLFRRVRKVGFKFPNDEDLEELEDFLKKCSGNRMTHLLFLKDKCFYFSQDKKVLIAYTPYKDKMVVLGDPIGEKELFINAILEFRHFADKFDMIPVIYEASDENLSIYHDNGYEFFKLGEEALINLVDFNLTGKKKQDLRIARNKMDKNEFQFAMTMPPFDKEFLDKLRVISDEWLGERKEKGFSVGWFDTDYLNRAPIAVINRDDDILAFASIMPIYDNVTISIDLMRGKVEAPSGVMDALFLGIINWSKDNGYKQFSLGVAPLSNVGSNPYSHTDEKLGKYVYNYGNKIYSFRGLRKFKEKFQPEWKGVYLAYPKGAKLTLLVLELALLAGKHKE